MSTWTAASCARYVDSGSITAARRLDDFLVDEGDDRDEARHRAPPISAVSVSTYVSVT